MVNLFSEAEPYARTGLRELNDLTLSRLEARFEQRVTQCETRLEGRLAALEARHRAGMAKTQDELHDWMFFIFLIGQVCLTLGLVVIGIASRR